MIVLGTNVVSEAMKPEPDATVRAMVRLPLAVMARSGGRGLPTPTHRTST